MNFAYAGEVAALGTAICYTFVGILLEAAGKRVGSLAVNLIRLVIGFIFLSIFAFYTRGLLFPIDSTVHNWTWLSISGVIGFFLGDLFLVKAYVEIGTRITLLINGVAPPLTAVLGYIFMRETLSPMGILGMLTTVGGIALVILGRDIKDEKIKFRHPIKGIFFAFMSAVGNSIGMIFSKVGMGEYHVLAATQIRIIAGIISFIVLFAYLNKWTELKTAIQDTKAMWFIVAIAMFGPFLGVSLSLASLKYTSVGVSATLTSVAPIIILPYSMLVKKEKLDIKEIIGTTISVLGIAILFLI